jgi:sugar lactone lactonase YvrE
MQRRLFRTQFMRTQVMRTLAIGSAIGLAGAAVASDREWRARPIVGANEVPPVASAAAARASFEVEDGALKHKLRIDAPITGATQSHIHLQPSGATPGAGNGPVVVFLFGLNPTGQNFQKGDVIAEGKLLPSAFVGPLAGKTLTEIVAALDSGRAYVNVHTLTRPGGEIRGQVTMKPGEGGDKQGDKEGSNEGKEDGDNSKPSVLRLPNVDPANVTASRPEGVAIGGGQVYVSSVGSGAIFRAGLKDSDATVFLPAGSDARTAATGMQVNKGRLFISGASTGKLFVYGTDGALQFSATAPGAGGSFINDVAVAKDGTAYFTDSVRPSLYLLRRTSGSWQLEEFVSFAGTPFAYVQGFNANGIVIDEDSKYALVVQSNTGKLFRVGLSDRSVVEVPVAGGGLPGGDGLVLADDNKLLVIGSGVVKTVRLNEDWLSGTVVNTTTNPSFVSPTTGALKEHRLWVVNAQFNRGANPVLPFTVSIIDEPN